MKYSYFISAILLIGAFIQCPTKTNAQVMDRGETKINILYSYGIPTGWFNENQISTASPRGFGIEIMHFASNKIAIGGSFGWQDFYQKKPRNLYRLSDGSDISAVISNSVQTMPILAKVQYFPTAGRGHNAIIPFVSAGAGGNLVSYEQLLGELVNASEFNANFAAQFGGGIRIPFGKEKSNGFVFGAQYHVMPYSKIDGGNLNHMAIQAGIHIRLRDDGGSNYNRRRFPGDERYRGF